MLKRSIVVLAALSLVVALLPSVALAGAADITHVEVVVEDSDGTAVAGVTVDVLMGALSVWVGGAKVTNGAGTTLALPTEDDNFDADLNTVDDFPQAGDAVVVTVDNYGPGTTLYQFPATLTDGDSDGEGQLVITVPALGSGSIVGLNQLDNDTSDTDVAWAWGGEISLYRDGILFATTPASPGGYAVLTGPGSFTVSSDISSTGVAVAGLNTNDLIDNGELMFFQRKGSMAGATVVTVPAGITVTGVDFLFENEDSNLNPNTFDHTDIGAFGDMIEHWAEAQASMLAGMNLVQGCTATNFCPEDSITRAEFAAILGREWTSNTYPVVLAPPYSDVPTAYWAAGWIQALKSAGIVSGSPGGSFGPETPITRAEAAAMIARWAIAHSPDYVATVVESDGIAGITTGDLPPATLAFVDVPTSYWAAKEISWLYKNGVFLGNADGTFGPEMFLTRAELAAIIARALPPAPPPPPP